MVKKRCSSIGPARAGGEDSVRSALREPRDENGGMTNWRWVPRPAERMGMEDSGLGTSHLLAPVGHDQRAAGRDPFESRAEASRTPVVPLRGWSHGPERPVFPGFWAVPRGQCREGTGSVSGLAGPRLGDEDTGEEQICSQRLGHVSCQSHIQKTMYSVYVVYVVCIYMCVYT